MNLEERRLARGVSQREIALAAGVTRQAIGALESGRAQPSITVAFALARALDVSVEELFGTNDRREQPPATGPRPARSRRCAVARIGDRIVSRPLDPELLAIEPLHPNGPGVENTIFVAGCETGIGLLTGHLNAAARGYRAIWFSATNREALADLRFERAHVAAIHGSPDEVKRLLAAREPGPRRLVAFASQDEGWLLARGNPRRFRNAAQILRENTTIANRPRGSAARGLLDEQLRAGQRDPATVRGYARELRGQLDAGRAVAAGFADAAIGMRSVAQLFDLDFLPLRTERCVLVIPRNRLRHPGVAALLETLRGAAFRRDLDALEAYDVGAPGADLRRS
jgi:putative molybdopterin biosynthesis protein